MGTQMVCFIKKRFGTCLWEELQKLDQQILKKKKYFSWVQEQINNYEICIVQQNYLELLKQPLRLYDGYDWEDEGDVQLRKPTKGTCFYQQYGCQDLYNLKKNVLSYHATQLSQLLLEYNQWVCLLLNVKKRLQSNQSTFNEVIISFEKAPIFCIGSVFRADLKFDHHLSQGNQPIPFEICYTDESLEVVREVVDLYLQKANIIMEGTYLMPLGEEILWIQVQLKPEYIQEKLVIPIMKCLNQVIKQFGQVCGKQRGHLRGSYIDIEAFSIDEVNRLTTLLTPLGYEAIGKMKNGQFRSHQLLINRKK